MAAPDDRANRTGEARAPLTEIEFRHLGEGRVGYVRPVTGGDLKRRFPGIEPMRAVADEIRLWGLFGADGSPLVLSDERANLVEAAADHELVTVSVH